MVMGERRTENALLITTRTKAVELERRPPRGKPASPTASDLERPTAGHASPLRLTRLALGVVPTGLNTCLHLERVEPVRLNGLRTSLTCASVSPPESGGNDRGNRENEVPT
jgi:hypothetical protein